jgi:hypothetical protein
MDEITGAPRESMEGISAREFAERHGIEDKAARKRLGEGVAEGKLISGWRKNKFGWMKVYRPK